MADMKENAYYNGWSSSDIEQYIKKLELDNESQRQQIDKLTSDLQIEKAKRTRLESNTRRLLESIEITGDIIPTDFEYQLVERLLPPEGDCK